MYGWSATSRCHKCRLYASGSSIPDGHLTIVDDNRHLSLPSTVAEHFLHTLTILFNIMIDMIRVRRTGAIGVGSTLFTKNQYRTHEQLLGHLALSTVF